MLPPSHCQIAYLKSKNSDIMESKSEQLQVGRQHYEEFTHLSVIITWNQFFVP